MALLTCCVYLCRSWDILALAAAGLDLAAAGLDFSNCWRFTGFFGGLRPRQVPMNPGGARDFVLRDAEDKLWGADDLVLGCWTSLTPGLLSSLLPGVSFVSGR